MIKTIYLRAANVLLKKPFVLWGISLLEILLSAVAWVLFGTVMGAALAITWLLSTSMTMIFLSGYRKQEVKCVQLFDAFRDWATIKRVLGGMGWMYLWIFLWALIPLVGWIFAIIRVYRYRLTPYILMTEPDVPPTQAIQVSAQRTHGYKGKMFGADILVYVLYAAALLILHLLGLIPYIGALFSLISTLLSICFAIFSPLFFGLVKAAFYEEINSDHHCPQCGAISQPGSGFCSKCGAPLNPQPEA